MLSAWTCGILLAGAVQVLVLVDFLALADCQQPTAAMAAMAFAAAAVGVEALHCPPRLADAADAEEMDLLLSWRIKCK